MSDANTFRDTAAVATRAAEVPTADFLDGVNNASCQPGIGVALNDSPNMTGAPDTWTLLDQFEVARVPQVSQVIGGLGVTTSADWPGSGGIEGNGSGHAQFIVGVSNPASDGTVTVLGTANLVTLAAGWVTA